MAKYLKKKKNKRTPLVITIIALFLVLVLIALLAWGLHNTQESPSEQTDESGITDAAAESSGQDTIPAQINGVTLQEYALGKGLTLVEVGKYTGVYMEDGTDEIVSNVLMVIVRNDGEQNIQYAELTLPTAAGEAKFSLSTLPVGESMVLLEQNRMAWSDDENYTNAAAQNIALFTDSLDLCEDLISIQALDGVVNITNISGADISGDIVIYYKNASSDLLYGGITYRVRLEGGLKADEIRQITASHFSENGSRIMFVTVG